jgi:suppressor of G2 allele of SKP1
LSNLVAPSSTVQKKKNWDKIVEEETKGEKLEGEEGLNKVFQDIYANASEEQKRAMMKSYVRYSHKLVTYCR